MVLQVKTALLLSVLLIASVSARETIVIGGLDGINPSDTNHTYRIGLALSGGGARGLAAVGVLRAFEEKGLRVTAVAGVSIGGILGGLYACGHTPDDLTDILHHLDLPGLFSDQPSRTSMFLTQRQERDRHLLSIRFDGLRPVIPQALTAGQRLTTLLAGLTAKASYQAAGDFNKLPIPFRTIATDIVTGEAVVIDHGSLVDAMRATMAYPLAFTPLESGHRLLMDGGMVVPMPVDIVRQMCGDSLLVVALNTASPLRPKKDLVTPVDIANQATSIMTADQLRAELQQADFVITPEIDWASASDLEKADSLIAEGYRCGLKAADSIITILHNGHSSPLLRLVELSADSCGQPVMIDSSALPLGRQMDRTGLVEQLKALVRDRGWFGVEAELNTVCSSAVDDRDVTLHLTATPTILAPQARLTVTGNRLFSDSALAARLIDTCRALTPAVLRQGTERIRRGYRDLGFDLADVKSLEVDPCDQTVALSIDEGIITEIVIEGNRRTRSWYIRSNLPLHTGALYSTAKATKGLMNIYGTDLFSSVSADLVPVDSGVKVQVRVQERAFKQLRLGWHWDEDYRSEEFIEVLDDNVFGAGLQQLVHAQYAPDHQEYYGAFKADRIFDTYLTSTVRLYHSRLNRYLYDTDGDVTAERLERQTGAEIRLGQQIARLGTVSAAVTVEQVSLKEPWARDPQRLGLRLLRLESLVETFNRVPFPKSGKKHHFELIVAGKFLGGDEQFTRFYSSVEAYWALGSKLNYHPRVDVGISRSGLPASEKFYLGGAHSFAGLRRYQLAGDKMLHLSNELRLKLPYRFYVTARWDLGDVFESVDQIKVKSLRHGGGLLIAFDSPIGPLEVGYGWAEKEMQRLYINVGLAF